MSTGRRVTCQFTFAMTRESTGIRSRTRELNAERGQLDGLQGLDRRGVAQVVQVPASNRDRAVPEQFGYLADRHSGALQLDGVRPPNA